MNFNDLPHSIAESQPATDETPDKKPVLVKDNPFFITRRDLVWKCHQALRQLLSLFFLLGISLPDDIWEER